VCQILLSCVDHTGFMYTYLTTSSDIGPWIIYHCFFFESLLFVKSISSKPSVNLVFKYCLKNEKEPGTLDMCGYITKLFFFYLPPSTSDWLCNTLDCLWPAMSHLQRVSIN